MGYPEGLLIDGTSTETNVLNDTMIKHNIIGEKYVPKDVVTTPDDPNVVNLLLNHADNRYYTGNSQILLKNPYNLNKPDVRPVAGSPALTGADFFSTGLRNNAFFTKTKYVGALAKSSAQNWATIWVNWKPQNTDYSQVNTNCLGPQEMAQQLASSQQEDKMESKGEVRVYPNPSHGSFNIDLSNFSGNVTIKVTNMSGAVVYTKQTAAIKNIVSVNLNAASGFYYVSVTDGKYSTTTKVNIVK